MIRIWCNVCYVERNLRVELKDKRHLIGDYADVQKCPKTTTTIANEMLKWYTRGKKRKVEEVEGDELQSIGFIGSNNPPTSMASQQTKKASASVKVVGKKVRPLDVSWRENLYTFVIE